MRDDLEVWNGLAPRSAEVIRDLSRAAQEKIREATASVDNFPGQVGLERWA